uniref:Uncharacterized protein n=1 Tax=Anguilla anguilla TaxID=7936 RepID=A0A0E9SC11_ANGAN
MVNLKNIILPAEPQICCLVCFCLWSQIKNVQFYEVQMLIIGCG